MYCYALIDSTTFVCYELYESETQITDNPYYIEIDSYDESYILRKKYVDGVWYDTTADEAAKDDARFYSIDNGWLDDKIYTLENVIENHTHDEYASSDDLQLLEDTINAKADATHSHSEYALTSHSHDEYVSQISLNSLTEEVNKKANATHTHDDYATTTSLDELSTVVSGKADSSHSHNDMYYTETEVDTLLSSKASASHSHNDIYYTETEIDTKLADKSDVSHNHDTDYDAVGSASNALTSAKDYTDAEVAELASIVSAKANTTDLTSHTNNTTIHVTSTDKTNWDAAKTHADSTHAPVNAEENQNAFSNIVIGSTTISADQKTDTLTLVAGSNVTLTPDSTGDSITISSANTVYTHPTTSGNKHIPSGGSSGQILRWSSDGTAVWGNDNNTTYSEVTQTVSGLMSATDKAKLDGIDEGANNYTLPSAGSSLGGVKTGGDVTISSGVITVNDDSHNHVISNIDGLQTALDNKASSSHNHDSVYYTQTQVDTLLSGKADSSHTHTIANVTGLQSALDGKASTSHGTHVTYSTTVPVMDGTASTGTASTVARSDHKHPTDTSRASQTDLTSHTSNVSNPHGVTLAQLGVTATASELNALDGITATVTELNYMDGVTSNVQTQLNAKASSSHTHSYAGSSSVGGAATSANKLNTNAGDANTPVYFANGVPVVCTSLDLSTSGNAATATNVAWSGVTSKPSYYDAKAIKSITRSGITFTYTCMDGTTGTFTQQDNNTTYSVATTSANGLMSATDKVKLNTMELSTLSEVETYLGI